MTTPLPALARRLIGEGKRVTVYQRPSRVCPLCGVDKPVRANKAKSGFLFRSRNKIDGAGNPYVYVCPRAYCKVCQAELMRIMRADPRNKKASSIKERNYRRAHKDQEARAKRRYRTTGKPAASEKRRRYNTRLKERAPLVVQVVAAYYDLTVDEMLHPAGRSRENYAMEARAIAAYLLGPSWGHIGATDTGRMLNLDHSTALHHQERLRGRRGSYEERTAKKECLAELRKLWAPRTRARDKKRQKAA